MTRDLCTVPIWMGLCSPHGAGRDEKSLSLALRSLLLTSALYPVLCAWKWLQYLVPTIWRQKLLSSAVSLGKSLQKAAAKLALQITPLLQSLKGSRLDLSCHMQKGKKIQVRMGLPSCSRCSLWDGQHRAELITHVVGTAVMSLPSTDTFPWVLPAVGSIQPGEHLEMSAQFPLRTAAVSCGCSCFWEEGGNCH